MTLEDQNMQKIEKAISYKEKVYKQLKTAIISQKIKPGEILNERKLADDLGISRTPIREALQMLVNDGWVVVEPWKGAFVNPLTEQDLIEVFQVRESLECLAIEIIAEIITDEQIALLSNIYDRQEEMAANDQANEFIELDRQFHMEIGNFTNNKILIGMLNNLSDMILRLGVQAVQDANRFNQTLGEHTAILEALKARDKKKALEAITMHILITKDNLYKRFKKTKE